MFVERHGVARREVALGALLEPVQVHVLQQQRLFDVTALADRAFPVFGGSSRLTGRGDEFRHVLDEDPLVGWLVGSARFSFWRFRRLQHGDAVMHSHMASQRGGAAEHFRTLLTGEDFWPLPLLPFLR